MIRSWYAGSSSTVRATATLSMPILVLSLLATAGPQSTARRGLPTAREIIQRHVAAVGGEAALKSVRSRYIWGRYEYPARRLRGTIELFAARPNKRVLKIQYPDVGTEVTGFDGTIGWTTKPGEAPKLLQGADLALLRDESIFDFDLHPDSLFRSLETLDLVDFRGQRCYRLHLVSVTGREWWEYYDAASGLFAGNLFRRITSKGPVTVITSASAYHAFGDVRLPTRLIINAAGVEENVTVIRVRDNSVEASVFNPPAGLR